MGIAGFFWGEACALYAVIQSLRKPNAANRSAAEMVPRAKVGGTNGLWKK